MIMPITKAHLIIQADSMQSPPALTVATKATVLRNVNTIFTETYHHPDISHTTIED